MHILVRETRSLDDDEAAVDLGQSPADLVYLSFSDSDLGAAADAWQRAGDLPPLRLANIAQLKHPMSVDLHVEQVIEHARCVVIRLLGGLDYWRYGAEEVARTCRKRGIALAIVPGDGRADGRLAELSTVSGDMLARLEALLAEGGPVNTARALWLAAHLAGLGRDGGDPVEPVPMHGEYRVGGTGPGAEVAEAASGLPEGRGRVPPSPTLPRKGGGGGCAASACASCNGAPGENDMRGTKSTQAVDQELLDIAPVARTFLPPPPLRGRDGEGGTAEFPDRSAIEAEVDTHRPHRREVHSAVSKDGRWSRAVPPSFETRASPAPQDEGTGVACESVVRPLAVIVFYRAYLLAGDLAPVDALADALRGHGLDVRALHVASLKAPETAHFVAETLRAWEPAVVLNATGFSARLDADGSGGPSPLDAAGAPVLQVVLANAAREAWQESARGLSQTDLAMQVVLPELDGRLLSTAISFKEQQAEVAGLEFARTVHAPDRDGIALAAARAAGWARLAGTARAERRIALVLSDYPGAAGQDAHAVGLDAIASTAEVLRLLEAEGYDAGACLPDDRAVVAALCDAQPTPFLSLADYRRLFATLPEETRRKIVEAWGEPEADPAVVGSGGTTPLSASSRTAEGRSGIGEPRIARGLSDPGSPLRYGRDDEGKGCGRDDDGEEGSGATGAVTRDPADAVVRDRAGTGTGDERHFALRLARFGKVTAAVQPDRGNALDRKASYHDPDLPPRHAYVAFYLWLREVEGVDAILHLGTHGTLEWLPGKAVALSAGCAPTALIGGLPVIYPFIVNNPGEAAAAKRRLGAVTIGHLTPPLKLAGSHGAATDLERLIDEFAAADGLDRRRTGILKAEILERADEAGLLAESGASRDMDEDDQLARLDAYLCDVKDLQIRDGLHVFGRAPAPEQRAALIETLRASCPDLDADLLGARLDASAQAERAALLAALDGHLVSPGPSGAPTRGRADVLPTGRNLFAVDPRAVPTRSALVLAEKAAEDLVRRHMQDHGDWPRSLVIDLWGSATMRTGGEDLGLALVLVGARPVWDTGSNRVNGFEILPLALLERPRVDVTLRVSGLFRDAFEAQIALFDAVVRAIAGRDEEPNWNPLAAAARGLTGDAFRKATTRIYGAAPGAYGAGVTTRIESGAWDERGELGAAYLSASAHAYGQGLAGERDEAGFADRVRSAGAFVHQQDHAEIDLLDTVDFAAHEGGFAAAAEALGAHPALYHADTSTPEAPKTRTLVEEVARVVRGRAANPAWIAGMMRHGYRGGSEIARGLEGLYGFAATLPDRLDRQFDLVFDATLGDEAVDRFLEDNNPAARAAMADRFDEAIRRGLWRPRRNAVAEILGRRAS
ncbi:cobaltochelatase subunit CobN [Microbaculum marinum]|uniref:cobaltochelatase subunit CobN n=1 Tax=Microbaculum marinum TaxID=1764581 RepID=UPI00360BA4A2